MARERRRSGLATILSWVAIGDFVAHHGALPAGLAELPRRRGYRDTGLDAWERPLVYTIDGDLCFTLASLGRDGAAGGTGDDADLSESSCVVGGRVEHLRSTGLHGGRDTWTVDAGWSTPP